MVLTRGLALRARRTVEAFDDPEWMARFLDSLHRADLAAATLRGYRYDLHSGLTVDQEQDVARLEGQGARARRSAPGDIASKMLPYVFAHLGLLPQPIYRPLDIER